MIYTLLPVNSADFYNETDFIYSVLFHYKLIKKTSRCQILHDELKEICKNEKTKVIGRNYNIEDGFEKFDEMSSALSIRFKLLINWSTVCLSEESEHVTNIIFSNPEYSHYKNTIDNYCSNNVYNLDKYDIDLILGKRPSDDIGRLLHSSRSNILNDLRSLILNTDYKSIVEAKIRNASIKYFATNFFINGPTIREFTTVKYRDCKGLGRSKTIILKPTGVTENVKISISDIIQKYPLKKQQKMKRLSISSSFADKVISSTKQNIEASSSSSAPKIYLGPKLFSKAHIKPTESTQKGKEVDLSAFSQGQRVKLDDIYPRMAKGLRPHDWAEEVEVEEEMIKLGVDPNRSYIEATEEVEKDPDSESVDNNSDAAETDSMIDVDEMELMHCCQIPKIEHIHQMKGFLRIREQFINKSPEHNCLLNAMKIGNELIKSVAESNQLPSDVGLTVKDILKHRHDTFAYFFINEVIGVNTCYGTDMKFTDFFDIPSNRTPDYIIVYDKNVIIYEFTVVANMLRGHFLKGNKYSGKYDREVKNLTDNGYSVDYRPVFFSTSSDLEENLGSWKSLGFELSNTAIALFEKFSELTKINDSYVYSLSMDFKYLTRVDGIPDSQYKDADSLGWGYKAVYCNKIKFMTLKALIKTYEFEDDKYYSVKFSGNQAYIRQSTMPGSGLTTDAIKALKVNEYSIYAEFKNQLRGNVAINLIGKNISQDNKINLTDHGEKVELIPEDCTPESINNIKYSDEFSMDDYISAVNSISTSRGSGLTDEISFEKINSAMVKLRNNLNHYQTENLSRVPPLIDNPRRSFSNMFNMFESNDIKFSEGICLDISAQNLLQKSSIMLLYKSKSADYSHEEFVENPIKKNEYHSKLNDLNEFLGRCINEGLDINYHTTYKIIKTKLSGEKLEEFNNLTRELRSKQIGLASDSKANKRGLVNVNPEMRNTIKNDMNWQSCPGFKLYMGETHDLSELYSTFYSVGSKMKFDFSYPPNTDVKILKDLKKESLKDLDQYFSECHEFKGFQMLLFHMRLCYTLFSSSNRTFSHKYVLCDNLGLRNVALFVKGGKKITTTRKSKIYKLIYPTLDDANKWQTNLFSSNDVMFEETHWSSMHQDDILDGMALPYKFLSNYIFLREKYSKETACEILFIPVMLALHNRRKTEQIMHNVRYLIVNSISEYSSLDRMISTFEAPMYSAFEKSLFFGLADNFLKYAGSVKQWAKSGSNNASSFQTHYVNHPYLKRRINNIDDLTYIIYSTYMMSKGGYNQSVEQTNNMKSIMETHDYYNNFSAGQDEIINTGDLNEIYSHDFKYSPILSYGVGKMLASELRRKHAVTQLHIGYHRIMSDTVDSMANNRGLRYKNKDFFSHKGYYIIYKQIFETGMQEVIDIIDSDLSVNQKYQKLRDINMTYKNQQAENNLEKVVFHVVDKKQRAGGREIYVMDYNTKLHQHPIEKMFKLMCTFIDNEIISVPASKRASLIHRTNFEYKSDKYTTYYMSYDCRKWAPRSCTEKYLYMLRGMRDVLPSEFISSVEFYFDAHKRKEIWTRKEILSQLNKSTKDKYSHYFQIHNEEGGASFVMPYSFVMGIFNMLSSLFHAGVQLVIRRKAEDIGYDSKRITEFNMMAHSDDSAGRLSIQNMNTHDNDKIVNEIAVKILNYYENFQKCTNHLMSVKKCNTSKQYFELLSVLYLNSELLPVLPKFLSGFSSVFTGEGLSSDLKQVVSKSIELLSNGASNKTAYLCQIIYSNFYRNFYRIKFDNEIPSIGGTANSWPPLYMAYGAAIDEVRVSYCNPEFYTRFMTFSNRFLDYDMTDGTVSLKFRRTIKIPRAYRSFAKSCNLPEFDDNKWFFSQNKTRHAKLNVFWFRAMIDKPNFAVSLLNINEIRRAYDSLYMASGPNIIGKAQNFRIDEIDALIAGQEPTITKYHKYLNLLHKPVFDLYDDMSKVESYSFRNRPQLGYKPCTITTMQFSDSPCKKFNSLQLAVQMCRSELTPYLFTQNIYGPEIDLMKNYLNGFGLPDSLKLVKSFLDYLNKYQTNVNSFYCDVGSQNRLFRSEEGVIDLIFTNHSSNQQLNLSKNFLRHNIDLKNEFNKELVDRINAQYLYLLYKSTKAEDIGEMIVKIVDSHMMVREIPFKSTNKVIKSCYNFLNLTGKTEEIKINLQSMDNWAFWKDRQGKIKSDWIGEGIIAAKINGTNVEIDVKNEKVIRFRVKEVEECIFSNEVAAYIEEVFKSSNLQWMSSVNQSSSDIFFGVNNLGLIGFHDPFNILLGVPVTVDPWMDVGYSDCRYLYDNGRHVVKINSLNYKLTTMDYIIYQKHKGSLLNLINWDSISGYNQRNLIASIYSGEFGDFNEVTFERNEILKSIQETELYNLVYSKVIVEKIPLDKVFLDDIVSKVTLSEDLLPLMYENIMDENMQKIIPDSKKDILRLYKFYDSTNDNLFMFRQAMANMSDKSQMISFYSRVLLDLSDQEGLTTLPEIGDPEKFKMFYMNESITLNDSYWTRASEILADALVKGFNQLSNKYQRIITNEYRMEVNEENILNLFYEGYRSERITCDEYQALTKRSITTHRLLDMIFDFKPSFVEFAKAFRRTIMGSIPRHPRYKEDWQVLLANMFKKFTISNFENVSDIPSSCRRRLTLDDRLTQEYEVIPPQQFSNAPVLDVKYKLDEYKNFEDTYTMINDNVAAFNFNYRSYNVDKASLDDFADDNDQELELVRRGEYRSGVMVTRPYLTNICADKFLVLPWYFPSKNTYVTTIRNKTYFVYNVNEDIARNKGFVKENGRLLSYYKEYIKYYEGTPMKYVREEVISSVPRFDDEMEKMSNITQTYSLFDPESYDSNLSKELCNAFDVKDEEVEKDLRRIILSKTVPTMKLLGIKKILKNFLQSDNKDVGSIILDVFKNFKFDIKRIDVGKEVKLDLSSAGKDKSKLIRECTTLRVELEQLDSILQGKVTDVVLKSSVLSSGLKRHISKNIDLMIQHSKIKKNTQKEALLRILKAVCDTIREGDTNTEGQRLDETLRELLTEMIEPESDEESMEEIAEPIYTARGWRLQNREIN